MKKKDAIERLAKELESRDQRQFEDATKAAGNAAEVVPIIKDYKALAKEHMQRAATELAFDRAMLQIDKQRERSKGAPLVTAYTVGTAYSFRYGPTPLPKGVDIPDMLRQGWTDAMLRNEGYIL